MPAANALQIADFPRSLPSLRSGAGGGRGGLLTWRSVTTPRGPFARGGEFSCTRFTIPMAFLVAIGVIGGCNNHALKPPASGPPEVIVNRAIEQVITDYEDFTGRLEAFKRVDIQARVTGFLDKVNFKEGSVVAKGSVLFEIDPSTYQADLDKADAAVVQAQARFKRLEGDLLRAQDLLRVRSISKEEFEKIVGDHAEARAAVGVAKASRATAQLFLNYTKVISPIDGIVGRTFIDQGNLVKADSTILSTVVTKDPIYAYFDVDERTVITLRRLVEEGTIKATDESKVTVSMALADEDNFPHKGIVDFEDNIIDPNTGTRRLRGVFANPKGFFSPGMFVRIRFQVGLPHLATLVPEQGVGTDQGQKFVYVVNDDNVVEYRKVKTGALLKGLRVIEKATKPGEGVKPGEQIVVSGLQRVRSQAKVDPILQAIPDAKAHESPKAILKDPTP
jgi:RND family efflux transporter MFP subunit